MSKQNISPESCLMIMNPRDIPECILSLKSLPIDKVWFRGYTEPQLEPIIHKFISDTKYKYYILVSDDVIVTQNALENLIEYQNQYSVITGWCNIYPVEAWSKKIPLANLELKPIENERTTTYFRVRDNIPKRALPIIKKLLARRFIKDIINHFLYKHFPTEDDIWSQEPIFRTYFIGWALTSIHRDLWLKHGFHYPTSKFAGHGSDQKMSLDLASDNIPMYCARDSFVFHLASIRNFIVGKVESRIIFDPFEPQSYNQDYISAPST